MILTSAPWVPTTMSAPPGGDPAARRAALFAKSSEPTLTLDGAAGGSGGGTSATAARMEEGQDRFLRLLVAQMSNQDPLNPLDNAQVTTQLAQISTVNSIEQLNRTMTGFVSQFGAQQALQAANLVGRGVLIEGDRMRVIENAEGARMAHGGFEMLVPSGQVRLEVLNAAGEVIDTVELGSAPAGRHPFTYDATDHEPGAELQFRVVAGAGDAATPVATYSVGFIDAISVDGGDLTLELGWLGSVPYAAARTFL